jgi:hypothetical protein
MSCRTVALVRSTFPPAKFGVGAAFPFYFQVLVQHKVLHNKSLITVELCRSSVFSLIEML